MGKLRDIIVPLDFEHESTHIVDFDPNADTVTLKGREGDYDAMPVKEDGKVRMLSLSNNSLLRQIQYIDKPCKLKLTRTGKGFQTAYEVEQVK